MASYSVHLQPSVERDVRHIPRADCSRIFARIEALSSSPLPPGALKLSDAEGLYRIRAGNYRIVYQVDHKTRRVVVHYVRHRRDAYRRL
ncbi:MAG: type II toxin-antitoxin system RelE/ParE family toxin [Thermoguttaceae bacterium]